MPLGENSREKVSLWRSFSKRKFHNGWNKGSLVRISSLLPKITPLKKPHVNITGLFHVVAHLPVHDLHVFAISEVSSSLHFFFFTTITPAVHFTSFSLNPIPKVKFYVFQESFPDQQPTLSHLSPSCSDMPLALPLFLLETSHIIFVCFFNIHCFVSPLPITV